MFVVAVEDNERITSSYEGIFKWTLPLWDLRLNKLSMAY